MIPPRGSAFARTALAGLNRSGPSPVCVNARKSLPFSVLQQFTHIHPVVVRRSSGAWLPNWMRKDGAGRKTAFVQKKKLTRCSPPDGEAGRNFVYDLSTYVTGCKNFKDKQHFHHKVFHEIRNSKKKKKPKPRGTGHLQWSGRAAERAQRAWSGPMAPSRR